MWVLLPDPRKQFPAGEVRHAEIKRHHGRIRIVEEWKDGEVVGNRMDSLVLSKAGSISIKIYIQKSC
jgi:hypothetical protein